MKRLVSIVGFMSVLFFVSFMATSVVFAEGAGQAQSSADYRQANLKNGAQLYDNWLKITDIRFLEIILYIHRYLKNQANLPGGAKNVTAGII